MGKSVRIDKYLYHIHSTQQKHHLGAAAFGRKIRKIAYSYHYQRADGSLVFRYDNAPHHPEVFTFPNHIHIEGRVEAAEPPDLGEVLRRIDGLLYPTGQQDSALNNQAEEIKL